MPYIYSPQEIHEATRIKAKAVQQQNEPKELRNLSVDSTRAAGHHHFVVANMFGPIDWAIEVPPEKTPKTETKEDHWIVDANMFGPMDWAAELEKQGNDLAPLKPTA